MGKVGNYLSESLYILTGKDGKTPAERLGLAQAPLDYEDIIYFTSTD